MVNGQFNKIMPLRNGVMPVRKGVMPLCIGPVSDSVVISQCSSASLLCQFLSADKMTEPYRAFCKALPYEAFCKAANLCCLEAGPQLQDFSNTLVFPLDFHLSLKGRGWGTVPSRFKSTTNGGRTKNPMNTENDRCPVLGNCAIPGVGGPLPLLLLSFALLVCPDAASDNFLATLLNKSCLPPNQTKQPTDRYDNKIKYPKDVQGPEARRQPSRLYLQGLLSETGLHHMH